VCPGFYRSVRWSFAKLQAFYSIVCCLYRWYRGPFSTQHCRPLSRHQLPKKSRKTLLNKAQTFEKERSQTFTRTSQQPCDAPPCSRPQRLYSQPQPPHNRLPRHLQNAVSATSPPMTTHPTTKSGKPVRRHQLGTTTMSTSPRQPSPTMPTCNSCPCSGAPVPATQAPPS